MIIAVEFVPKSYDNQINILSAGDLARKFGEQLVFNSDKPASKQLFNLKVYRVESNILVLRKDYIANDTLKYLYLLMVTVSVATWLFFGFKTPLIIVSSITSLFYVFSSRQFNFLLLKIMARRMKIKNKIRLL